MEAILKACANEDYPAQLALVISDNPDAAGLRLAEAMDIPHIAIARGKFGSKLEHEASIRSEIDAAKIDLICLAGYMRLLSADFTDAYPNRIINIHPSLLPKHKGLDTHQRVLDSGDAHHGCTVHFVNAEMDGGRIIAQAQISVEPGDTAETLARRVLVEEHKLYPQVIRELCEDG